MQKEYAAEISFKFAWEAEKTHLNLYHKAKEAAIKGKDVVLDIVGVCNVCGYTIEGELPEKCPVCKAKKDSQFFRKN